MSNKMVIVMVVVLSALVAVQGQTPSDSARIPVNATVCQYEYPNGPCYDCCINEGYGAGAVIPTAVQVVEGQPPLKGAFCLCSGSIRLNEQVFRNRQIEYVFSRTVAPSN